MVSIEAMAANRNALLTTLCLNPELLPRVTVVGTPLSSPADAGQPLISSSSPLTTLCSHLASSSPRLTPLTSPRLPSPRLTSPSHRLMTAGKPCLATSIIRNRGNARLRCGSVGPLSLLGINCSTVRRWRDPTVGSPHLSPASMGHPAVGSYLRGAERGESARRFDYAACEEVKTRTLDELLAEVEASFEREQSHGSPQHAGPQAVREQSEGSTSLHAGDPTNSHQHGSKGAVVYDAIKMDVRSSDSSRRH